MSKELSPSTDRAYGVKMVCDAWDIPRSSFYNQHSSKPQTDEEPPPKKKRGPKPKISDEERLELIKQDVEESSFIGEGHRKVWARFYYDKKIKVAKKRVLRIMRESNLLSPYRVPQAPAREHTGRITTDEPNVMWGTDGAKVFTLEEGWGWIFVNVEHWNAEVLGWHVCKKGNRFAALEPVSQGVLKEFGSVEAGITCGLELMLRMDSGSQYRSEDFLNQVKAWGSTPSFAFFSEPQTNGVVERFIRPLKEQVIYGRTFRTIEDVRQAVAKFVELYNNEWLLEKNGYLSQMRNAYYGKIAA